MNRPKVIGWGACAVLLGSASCVCFWNDAAGAAPLDEMRKRHSGILFQAAKRNAATHVESDRFGSTPNTVPVQWSINGYEAMKAHFGSGLPAKSAHGKRGFHDDWNFRISIQQRHESAAVFDGLIPINGDDGACSSVDKEASA